MPEASQQLQKASVAEFDAMVKKLRDQDIDVLVVEDTETPPKPDAVFPNNWISTTPDGKLIVYPLYARNRRAEKRDDVVDLIKEKFAVAEFQDWSEYEVEGKFLEGTGSMVIDHRNKLIYAAISERTSISLLEKYAAGNNYQAIAFMACDAEGRPVYHTNVMMSLGSSFAVLCEEAFREEWELIAVRQLLESTDHSIIPISLAQVEQFAGNMLEVKNNKGENILVISQRAFDALKKEQKRMLEAFGQLLPVAVPSIETAGGGSVRCMMAEIFLKKQ